jgi:DNA-binding NtrC family response regulator
MTRALRILVVDDDIDHAQSLGELFELEGHDVTVVNSGEDAIRAYREVAFDVAFMDVVMPGKNGVESFLEIKRMRPAARVYMMTGYSVEQLLKQAMTNGAMGVLSKPLDPARMLEVISEIGPEGIAIVAEDDPSFGSRLERIITESGRRCQLVTSGSDALRAAEAGGGSLLILDLKAPLIDGVDTYARIKTAGRAAPTIIITAKGPAYDNTLDAIGDVAVTGILNKPFDPLDLLSRLDGLSA